MTTRQDQISTGHSLAESTETQGAARPVSPGILAVALLLALTTSVASAGAIDWSDPARSDRREAPRELTVRWLTEAVAKAVKELAEFELGSDRSAKSITNRSIAPSLEMLGAMPIEGRRTASRETGQPGFTQRWPEMGLLNLPPPSVG